MVAFLTMKFGKTINNFLNNDLLIYLNVLRLFEGATFKAINYYHTLK